MKKLFLLSLISLFVTSHKDVFSQFSKQEAIDLVLDSIASDRIDSVNIYMEPIIITDEYYLASPYDSIDAPYSNYWLAFIDEQPLYLWDHLCTYLFINSVNGDYTSVYHYSPPVGYSMEFDSLSISKEIVVPSPDYSVPYSGLQVEENEHYHAVLFSGYGQNVEPAFWNHLSHMYCTLIEKGFTEENIYVLSGDGTQGSGPWANNNLNLNNTGDDDIMNVPCTVNNLDSIFQLLETNLTEDDLLYLFATTHGSRIIGDTGTSYLKLYQDEKLWDDTLADMLAGINCSQMIIPIYACHSGGFVDDLMVQTHNEKRAVFAPVDWNRGYVRNLQFINMYGMDVFPYFLITSFRGKHPESKFTPWNTFYEIGTHPGDTLFPFFDSTDFHPDYIENLGNGDSTIQLGESIYYTKVLDSSFYNFGVIDYDCGFKEDLLSLTGLSGNIDTTQSVSGNFIVGGDLTLRDSAVLTIDDGSKFFIVKGDIHTNKDSELIFGDSLLIKNFQEKGSIIVEGDFSSGTGSNIESIDSTTFELIFENNELQVELSDFEFKNASIYGFTDSLTINSLSTFDNSRIRGAKNLIVDNVTFNNSSISLIAPGLSNYSATIKNSDFSLRHPEESSLISLYRYATYNISSNTFENYTPSDEDEAHCVAIEFSGTTGPTAINKIDENTFTSSEDGYSNTTGILVYSSLAQIINNNIQAQHVGVMLAGRSQSVLTGNSNFCEEETQVIKNNNIYQVYMSEYSFPTSFIWNAIYHDTLTKCFLFHDIDTTLHHDSVIVSNNYWSDQHDPYYNLLPLDHYYYYPIYEPCKKSTVVNNAETQYQTGISQIAAGNYFGAKITFQELISDYPKTEYANNAMKDIFSLEPLADNDFSSLKSWYRTEDSIVGNERLYKLGQNLANKCDENLENYVDAIDWYEDMIEEPPTLQDSVFAIIDLENCYLQMGIDTSLKSSNYVGRLPQYKPASVKAHQDHRDKLLALLLRHQGQDNTPDKELENMEVSKPGLLYQNAPNPLRNNTQITYWIKDDSHVKISIFSSDGKLVKTINEGKRPNGTYNLVIDVSELKSGLYFYSISISGKIIDTKKMTIIK